MGRLLNQWLKPVWELSKIYSVFIDHYDSIPTNVSLLTVARERKRNQTRHERPSSHARLTQEFRAARLKGTCTGTCCLLFHATPYNVCSIPIHPCIRIWQKPLSWPLSVKCLPPSLPGGPSSKALFVFGQPEMLLWVLVFRSVWLVH